MKRFIISAILCVVLLSACDKQAPPSDPNDAKYTNRTDIPSVADFERMFKDSYTLFKDEAERQGPWGDNLAPALAEFYVEEPILIRRHAGTTVSSPVYQHSFDPYSCGIAVDSFFIRMRFEVFDENAFKSLDVYHHGYIKLGEWDPNLRHVLPMIIEANTHEGLIGDLTDNLVDNWGSDGDTQDPMYIIFPDPKAYPGDLGAISDVLPYGHENMPDSLKYTLTNGYGMGSFPGEGIKFGYWVIKRILPKLKIPWVDMWGYNWLMDYYPDRPEEYVTSPMLWGHRVFTYRDVKKLDGKYGTDWYKTFFLYIGRVQYGMMYPGAVASSASVNIGDNSVVPIFSREVVHEITINECGTVVRARKIHY